MPSKAAKKPSAPHTSATDDFDSYLLDGDLDVNTVRSPSPAGGKRKEPSGLGIEEEVEVKKRVHAPRVKLDEARLLSENGIPKLRKRAKHLHLKGKGHEWSDASRLLSFYQIWLDDLFPKAKFLDALAMVEKAGHKGAMHKARMGWIDEGKPRTHRDDADDDGDVEERREAPERTVAPIFEKRTGAAEGGKTPEREKEDPFEGEDIYGATPRAKKTTGGDGHSGEPDEDDLDALMAEVEGSTAPGGSLFGGPKPADSLFGGASKTTPAGNEPDEDDLDALMAEAETTATTSRSTDTRADGAVSSGDKAAGTAESEADDDLDALMAEVEAGGSSRPAPAKTSAPDPPQEDFADEEEAMAEMEGLW